MIGMRLDSSQIARRDAAIESGMIRLINFDRAISQ